jgi:hypothetical protein
MVWFVATRPGFGCGLARESVGGVGFQVVRFVWVSLPCVRLPRIPRCF